MPYAAAVISTVFAVSEWFWYHTLTNYSTLLSLPRHNTIRTYQLVCLSSVGPLLCRSCIARCDRTSYCHTLLSRGRLRCSTFYLPLYLVIIARTHVPCAALALPCFKSHLNIIQLIKLLQNPSISLMWHYIHNCPLTL